jgi:phosphoribosyl-AMP cyclohydrolase / phosphoribosyl-ATP pyrophosphohydrolase
MPPTPSMDASALWALLRPDPQGLVTTVVQHEHTGQVLMVGHMNAEALAATLARERVTFWSRSRSELWEKGATSGNTLRLRELRVDCDGDALLVRALPAGPTCHTGATSCFFRRVEGDGAQASAAGASRTPSACEALPSDDGPPPGPDPTLAHVFAAILERQAGRGMTNAEGGSYVRRLLDQGAAKINAKITEEAAELAQAIAGESDERVASEAAGLVFHALVGLAHRGLHLHDVARVLAGRFGHSGIDEKAGRTVAPE